MGCLKLSYYPTNFKVENYFKNCLTSNFSENNARSSYEMVSHLGNVHMVISDRKVPVEMGSSGNVAYYQSDVISTNDMYPFGSLMPQRSFSSGDYRYGFQGKEKVDEITGSSGRDYDFGNRMYDAALGRWWSIDRYAAKYAAHSPYSAFLNNPLAFIDAQGDSVELIIGKAYTKNGKEHPYGHVALRVFNAAEGYDMVYDFGRYGDVNTIPSSGEGILNVWTDGKAYVKAEQSMRNSVGYMKPTSTEEDKAIMNHFAKLTSEGSVYKNPAHPSVIPSGKGTTYKLNQEYNIWSNNCCTQSTSGLGVVGQNWLGNEYDPRDAYVKMESQYKSLNLGRTEYFKGGMSNTTFTPIQLNFNFNNFQFTPPATPVAQPDNTNVAPKSAPRFK